MSYYYDQSHERQQDSNEELRHDAPRDNEDRTRSTRYNVQSSYTPQQPIMVSHAYIPPTSSFSGTSRSDMASPIPRARSHINPSYYGGHGQDHDSYSYQLPAHEPDLDSTTYVAVDPFRPSMAQNAATPLTQPIHFDYHQYPDPNIYVHSHVPITKPQPIEILEVIQTFIIDTLPRQLYLHFLLRLPSFYFSRVTRIFEEAEMSMPEIKEMALAAVGQSWDPLSLQPINSNLKATWENFIDTLLREWKTVNIVSVLLLSAILTILQIDSAAADPITRNSALFSLICALMSLLYGCMYIIRFASMKKVHKAAEWAEEGRRTKTLIWWNVWVLLAMPATWLAWSIILYIVCIMAFIWRTGSTDDTKISSLSPRAELGPRIALSAYGDKMDKAWKERVAGWQERVGYNYGGRSSYDASSGRNYDYAYPPRYSQTSSRHSTRSRRSTISTQSIPPLHYPTPTTAWQNEPSAFGSESNVGTIGLIEPTKILDLRFQRRSGQRMPDVLVGRGILYEDWERFISEASAAWDSVIPLYQGGRISREAPLRPQDVVAQLIEKWNLKFFMRRGTRALLCQEYLPGFPESPAFAVYLVDWSYPDYEHFHVVERFNAVPEGLERIDIFDPPSRASRSRILGRTSIFSTRHPMEGRVHFGISLIRNPTTIPEQSPVESEGSRSYSYMETHQREDRQGRFRQRSRSREPSPPHMRRPRRNRSLSSESTRSTRSRSRSPTSADESTRVAVPDRGRAPRTTSPLIVTSSAIAPRYTARYGSIDINEESLASQIQQDSRARRSSPHVTIAGPELRRRPTPRRQTRSRSRSPAYIGGSATQQPWINNDSYADRRSRRPRSETPQRPIPILSGPQRRQSRRTTISRTPSPVYFDPIRRRPSVDAPNLHSRQLSWYQQQPIPGPPIIIQTPASNEMTRSLSRSRSVLSPLSLALRSSIRRHDSVETTDGSSAVRPMWHSLEPPDVQSNISVQSNLSRRDALHPIPVLAPTQQTRAANSTSAELMIGPWTRDINSLRTFLA